MYPVPLNDVLEVVRSSEFRFTSSGLTIPGDLESNLCVKAYQLMREKFAIDPVHIHLYKNIPMGGGLGGGSADAAETLKLLNQEFDLKIPNEGLKEMAAELGSDCPFFIENSPQFAKGRGEELAQIELNLIGKYLLLLNDGTHISTQEAYSNVIPKEPIDNLQEVIHNPIETWKEKINNQFEESVFIAYPHLQSIKEKLYSLGAIYASMSGSGATMYGLFKDRPEVEDLPKDFQVKKIIEL